MSQTRNWWNMMKYLWWNHENPFFHPGTLTLPNLRITLWQSQVGSEHKNVCFVKQTFEKNAGGARTQGQHGRPSDAKKRKHVKTLWKPRLVCFRLLPGAFPVFFASLAFGPSVGHRPWTASWRVKSCCCLLLLLLGRKHLVTNRLLPTAQNETTEHQLSKKNSKKSANAEILCDIYMWPQTHFLRDKLDQSKTHSCMFYGSLWLSHWLCCLNR